MSAETSSQASAGSAKVTLGVSLTVVVLCALTLGVVPALVIAMALLGTPLFAVMGGASELAWLMHPNEMFNHLRFIAPRVLDDHFAGSPILVTIPLFTFVGYVLARARTAERLVRFSIALLGWMPGGLAIVCVLASAVFTLLTGGSGVTIIAIGGLLMPALRKEGYSDKFSLGLITSGGSLGLLLPFSLPLLVYSLVAGVDTTAASQAILVPGLLVLVLFAGYAMLVGVRENVPRRKFSPTELWRSAWELRWEAMIPVLMAGGIVKLQLGIDECAGIVAAYTLFIEVFVYKEISLKRDLRKIAKSSMAMAGAVILILTMANALVNYVIQERIPDQILEKMLALGLDQTWQFLLIMNVFLLVLGMVMEGFSAIFVAVPLIIPFAARFHLSPFHVGAIFLLNLELAFCLPPLGLNLFISSFRFNRSATSLYRPILPFLGLLTVALLVISYVPRLSDATVRPEIERLRAKAEERGEAPRDAWLFECVQEDRLNPLPCSDADRAKYPGGKLPELQPQEPGPDTEAPPADGDDDDLLKQMAGGEASSGEAGSDDDLLQQMMGGGGREAGASSGELPNDDDLLQQMMGGEKAAPAPSAPPKADSDDELLKEMLGQ